MSRYRIEVRESGNGAAQALGGVVALVALVAFAAAGDHRIAAMVHQIEAYAVIAACAAFVLAVLAIAVRVAMGRRRDREAAVLAREAAIAAREARYLEAMRSRSAIDAPPLPPWFASDRRELPYDAYRHDS